MNWFGNPQSGRDPELERWSEALRNGTVAFAHPESLPALEYAVQALGPAVCPHLSIPGAIKADPNMPKGRLYIVDERKALETTWGGMIPPAKGWGRGE